MINEGYFTWKRRYTKEESPINSTCSFNNYRWMRYAEVLLLAAEANLMAGNQAEANACLNEVRQRAKLPFKEATLDAIKIEKRLELFCEYTRYQDIIRWEDAENLLKHQGEKLLCLLMKMIKWRLYICNIIRIQNDMDLNLDTIYCLSQQQRFDRILVWFKMRVGNFIIK